MRGTRYTEQFKVQALRRVTEGKHKIAGVAPLLSILRRILCVRCSGYYAWRRPPLSRWAQVDEGLTTRIKTATAHRYRM